MELPELNPLQWRENPVSIGCEPVFALSVVTAVLLMVGRLRNNDLRRLPVALRGGLAAMFMLTGVSHFDGMWAELVAIVPPALAGTRVADHPDRGGRTRRSDRPVVAATATAAAAGLSALLIGMFPANVYAAASGLETAYHQVVPAR